MHANNISPCNKAAVDLHPFVQRFKDGRVERLLRSSFVPASEQPAAQHGVATRDVVIDRGTGVSARVFLPSAAAATGRRLPVVIYVHGGCFCTESAFCRTYHRYCSSLAARAGSLIVSVEYRLAPEHPIPAAYDDSWAALQWAASRSDPWLAEHADPARTFLAGDSAGGNIVYHTAVRASRDENAVDVEGLVIVQPYFWGAERIPSETVWDGVAMFRPEFVDRVWPFVTAGEAGNDDPRINPSHEEIASLKCRRALVAVAGKDILRHRGRRLAQRMRDVTLVELEGEDHGFHLYSPLRATSKKLMESIVQFINKPAGLQSPATMALPEEHKSCSTWDVVEGKTKTYWALSMPTRPFNAILTEKNTPMFPRNIMPRTSLSVGQGKASKTSLRLSPCQLGRDRAYNNTLMAAVQGSYAVKNIF